MTVNLNNRTMYFPLFRQEIHLTLRLPQWPPQVPADSGTSWDPSPSTFPHCFASSSPSFSLPTPVPPFGPRLWSEGLALSSLRLLVMLQGLGSGHVRGLWCVNLVLCYRFGCLSTPQWGSRQGGLSSTLSFSCTCSWVCPSSPIASWHPLKSSPHRYHWTSYLKTDIFKEILK